MIILNTNAALKATFDRLLLAMKEPVEWNGQFVVIGNYLILHGRVRSLFFNFESKKLLTNIIDIPVKEEEIVEIGTHTKVQNVLNLALYAFGKWGLIRGITVEHDYAQINLMFREVLGEFGADPGYSRDNFRFYKDGIRISYEDVVQLAIEASDAPLEEAEGEKTAAEGLWHNLLWKRQKAVFVKTDTTFDERQKDRLGNNFYMVGYLCPKCREHLHMAVFPEGKEFLIETTEGGVLLARAYTCDKCCRFYTPRPKMLLAESDIYLMDFEGDGKAYQDYLELLGAQADRVSNYGYNEYADPRKRQAMRQDGAPEQSPEEICEKIEELDDDALWELEERIQEGFYPAKSVKRLELAVQKEKERRQALPKSKPAQAQKNPADLAGRAKPGVIERESGKPAQNMRTAEPGPDGAPDARANTERQALTQEKSGAGSRQEPQTATAAGARRDAGAGREIPVQRREAAKKRYAAKCNVLDRLSYEQVSELKRDLMRDANLYDSEKEPFLNQISQKEEQKKREHIQRLADSCKGESYAKIRRVIEEIEKTDVGAEEKNDLLEPLYEEKKQRGEAEVRELIQKLPKQMDLEEYRQYMERLNDYPEVDLSPYEEVLEEKKQQAENAEIARMIRHSRTNDRQGLVDLEERLKKQDFNPKTLEPYLEKLEDKIRNLDEEAIAEICGDPARMSAEETMEAYRKIEAGDFLPELKTNALEMLQKRLAKLKMEECELLVRKFRESLEGRINKNGRHHFYPAGRIMAKEAGPEEYSVIQYALDTYGTTRGLFEYPIFVVDTSRDKSGKEGLILTPEHLFYKTMLNAYAVSIGDIRRVSGKTGFLQAGITLELADGSKVKIPYVVDKKELVAWGNCMEEFIHYLQEKPDSRNVTYLAREKHEQICCFRCGFSYKGGNACPQCGYKMNQ